MYDQRGQVRRQAGCWQHAMMANPACAGSGCSTSQGLARPPARPGQGTLALTLLALALARCSCLLRLLLGLLLCLLLGCRRHLLATTILAILSLISLWAVGPLLLLLLRRLSGRRRSCRLLLLWLGAQLSKNAVEVLRSRREGRGDDSPSQQGTLHRAHSCNTPQGTVVRCMPIGDLAWQSVTEISSRGLGAQTCHASKATAAPGLPTSSSSLAAAPPLALFFFLSFLPPGAGAASAAGAAGAAGSAGAAGLPPSSSASRASRSSSSSSLAAALPFFLSFFLSFLPAGVTRKGCRQPGSQDEGQAA